MAITVPLRRVAEKPFAKGFAPARDAPGVFHGVPPPRPLCSKMKLGAARIKNPALATEAQRRRRKNKTLAGELKLASAARLPGKGF
ncbi:MAG: hypothetical protein M3416_08765 [Acidobacteriota bacterium]|nr:hypothetical protein [Acidobacteriota bacterium]